MTGGESLAARYGARGRQGAAGEELFHRALHEIGLDRFQVFRSLSIPGGNLRGDVDFVLANGDELVIVNVKAWQHAWAYWTIPLLGLPMKDWTPLINQGEWRLSQNEAASVDRYRVALPSAHVSAMVVFVPVGGTAPGHVSRLKWPGGVRSYLAGDAYTELYIRLGGRNAAAIIGRRESRELTAAQMLARKVADLGECVRDVPPNTLRVLNSLVKR